MADPLFALNYQHMSDLIMSNVKQAAVQAFTDLKQQITSRPLYVMFEQKLNCNPKVDHLFPKSILPLFDDNLDLALNTIVSACYPIILDSIMKSAYLQDENEDQLIIQHLLSQLNIVKELQQQLKAETHRHLQLQLESSSQLQKFLKMTNEQLYEFRRIGKIYKPDRKQNLSFEQKENGTEKEDETDNDFKKELQLKDNDIIILKKELLLAQDEIKQLKEEINNINQQKQDIKTNVNVDAIKSGLRPQGSKLNLKLSDVFESKAAGDRLKYLEQQITKIYQNDDNALLEKVYIEINPNGQLKQKPPRATSKMGNVMNNSSQVVFNQSDAMIRKQSQNSSRSNISKDNVLINYIYDENGKQILLDQPRFTRTQIDKVKYTDSHSKREFVMNADGMFVFQDEDGNQCYYTKTGQLIRKIIDQIAHVDINGRNCIPETMNTDFKKYITGNGKYYYLDYYANPYCFDGENKVPLNAEFKVDKSVQPIKIIEYIVDEQEEHDIGTATEFYFNGQQRYLVDLEIVDRENLIFVDPQTKQQFKRINNNIAQLHKNSWVFLSKAGVYIYHLDGLYDTPSVLCYQHFSDNVFKDNYGVLWYYDINQKCVYVKEHNGTKNIPINLKQLKDIQKNASKEIKTTKKETKDIEIKDKPKGKLYAPTLQQSKNDKNEIISNQFQPNIQIKGNTNQNEEQNNTEFKVNESSSNLINSNTQISGSTASRTTVQDNKPQQSQIQNLFGPIANKQKPDESNEVNKTQNNQQTSDYKQSGQQHVKQKLNFNKIISVHLKSLNAVDAYKQQYNVDNITQIQNFNLNQYQVNNQQENDTQLPNLSQSLQNQINTIENKIISDQSELQNNTLLNQQVALQQKSQIQQYQSLEVSDFTPYIAKESTLNLEENFLIAQPIEKCNKTQIYYQEFIFIQNQNIHKSSRRSSVSTNQEMEPRQYVNTNASFHGNKKKDIEQINENNKLNEKQNILRKSIINNAVTNDNQDQVTFYKALDQQLENEIKQDVDLLKQIQNIPKIQQLANNSSTNNNIPYVPIDIKQFEQKSLDTEQSQRQTSKIDDRIVQQFSDFNDLQKSFESMSKPANNSFQAELFKSNKSDIKQDKQWVKNEITAQQLKDFQQSFNKENENLNLPTPHRQYIVKSSVDSKQNTQSKKFEPKDEIQVLVLQQESKNNIENDLQQEKDKQENVKPSVQETNDIAAPQWEKYQKSPEIKKQPEFINVVKKIETPLQKEPVKQTITPIQPLSNKPPIQSSAKNSLPGQLPDLIVKQNQLTPIQNVPFNPFSYIENITNSSLPQLKIEPQSYNIESNNKIIQRQVIVHIDPEEERKYKMINRKQLNQLNKLRVQPLQTNNQTGDDLPQYSQFKPKLNLQALVEQRKQKQREEYEKSHMISYPKFQQPLDSPKGAKNAKDLFLNPKLNSQYSQVFKKKDLPRASSKSSITSESDSEPTQKINPSSLNPHNTPKSQFKPDLSPKQLEIEPVNSDIDELRAQVIHSPYEIERFKLNQKREQEREKTRNSRETSREQQKDEKYENRQEAETQIVNEVEDLLRFYLNDVLMVSVGVQVPEEEDTYRNRHRRYKAIMDFRKGIRGRRYTSGSHNRMKPFILDMSSWIKK
ncbi:Spindle_pole protein [Hexamita inflata]|uniref:Putative n=1 Tax=Hexamita inflata TaxID=28002 RepID=A0ABP1HRB7_9EUKA